MRVISDRRLLCSRDGISVYYKRGKLFFEREKTPIVTLVIPQSGIWRFLSRFRLTGRMFRIEPKIAVIQGNECFLSCHGYIYRCDWMAGTIGREFQYRRAMNNPVNFFQVEELQGFESGILYGEYWENKERDKVNIYQRYAGKWRIKYTFPKGTITHIHGFSCDKERNRIFILTGDFDEGSGIWVTTDDFRTVRPLLVGRQQYRSCVVFPCKEGILYATDTPLESNAIYLLNEKGHLKKIQGLPGPCIYGREYMDENGCRQYLLATSVEPDSRITGLKYLMTYKLGKGVKDRRTHVFAGNIQTGFHEVFSLNKDWLPMGLFQFGNIYFPNTEEIVCVPQSVWKFDGKTLSVFD